MGGPGFAGGEDDHWSVLQRLESSRTSVHTMAQVLLVAANACVNRRPPAKLVDVLLNNQLGHCWMKFSSLLNHVLPMPLVEFVEYLRGEACLCFKFLNGEELGFAR